MATPVRLGFVGDLLLGRRVSRAVVRGQAPSAMWGDLLPRMAEADALIGNLECPITAGGTRWPTWKSFRFRADPAVIHALGAGGFAALSLANNHMLDYGPDGLADTLAALRAAGIAHAGAGPDAEAARRPATFRAGDAVVGLFSLTDVFRGFAATADRPGTNFRRIDAAGDAMDYVTATVRALREGGADIVVMAVHWGPNYRWWPPLRYRTFARAAVEAGVDVVHGHSAHLLQGLEFHGRGLILYDTGDFVDDLPSPPVLRTNLSGLFLAEFAGGRPPSLRIVPARLMTAQVHAARGRDRAAVVRLLARRSRGMNVRFHDTGGDVMAEPVA